jgi:hypothetical protein
LWCCGWSQYLVIKCSITELCHQPSFLLLTHLVLASLTTRAVTFAHKVCTPCVGGGSGSVCWVVASAAFPQSPACHSAWPTPD